MSQNLIIAQGGGPTAVINASLAGVIAEAQKQKGTDRIYGAIGGIEGLMQERFVDLTEMSAAEVERLRDTPASGLGSCRYKVKEDDHSRIVDVLKKHRIGYFLYNGGNDSMDTCYKVAQLAQNIQVVGVPKTIDNDLAVTDHCPGFGSAARYNAVTTCELGLDVRALPIHVSVIEFMGRNAGWLTAASALARRKEGDAPHLIYLPERPFIEEQFLEEIKTARKTFGGVVVAVSEGLKDQHGKALADSGIVDGFGHTIPGGVAQALCEIIMQKTGIKARSEKPGLIARASKLLVSELDRTEAFHTGVKAVQTAADGKGGSMVGILRRSDAPYRIDYTLIPLQDVANQEKKLPDAFIHPNGNDVTDAFINYSHPLIGGVLPDYFTIEY